MPLINCKIHLELNRTKNCVMYCHDTYAGDDNVNNRETTFKITNTKLYVSIITLLTKGNISLTKQLNEGSKRLPYWNEYKTKIESRNLGNNNLARFFLMLLFKELKDCLFLLLTILLIVIKKLKETAIENIRLF